MAMERPVNYELRGDYKGSRDADIHFKFRFCDAGIYYYHVEQVGIWRLAHRGRFEIRPGLTLKPGVPEGSVIRLAPAIVDVDPKEQYVYDMLEERALPAKHTEDYRLSGNSREHRVNPKLKIISFNFWIPGADIFSNRDWSIEAISA